jgi:prephenate dehydrogenase
MDTTRLAAGSYDVWRPLIDSNRSQIDAALAAYIDRLQEIRAQLGTTLEPQFDQASRFATALRSRSVSKPSEVSKPSGPD